MFDYLISFLYVGTLGTISINFYRDSLNYNSVQHIFPEFLTTRKPFYGLIIMLFHIKGMNGIQNIKINPQLTITIKQCRGIL